MGNASDQVTIGFSFASDSLRDWRKFSGPITKRNEAKQLQSRVTFNTELKIAVSGFDLASGYFLLGVNCTLESTHAGFYGFDLLV